MTCCLYDFMLHCRKFTRNTRSRPLLLCVHLDAADRLLRLHHADVLGWSLVRQQLGGAQVVGCKDDPVNQVLGVTGSRDCRDGIGTVATSPSIS